MHSRISALVVACLAIALIAAGCGSSSSSSSGGGEDTGKGTGAIGASKGGEKKEVAVAAAEEEAKPKTQLEAKKVGFLNISGACSVCVREEIAAEEAAAAIGWTIENCDAEGTPSGMVRCASSLLTKGADFMISANVAAAPITAQMEQAESKGVPWVNIGGPETESPLFTTQIVESEQELGKVMTDYMFERINDEGEIAYTTYPAIRANKELEEVLLEGVAERPKVKIVDKHIDDLADFVGDAARWSNVTLQQHPDLSAIFSIVNPDVPGIVQGVERKFPGAQFPERPLIGGRYADLPNEDLLRKKQIDFVGEVPLEANSWMAIDQAAQFFAREEAFTPFPGTGRYKLTFLKPKVITQETVPKEVGAFPEPEVDFVTFFTTKWEKEFPSAQ